MRIEKMVRNLFKRLPLSECSEMKSVGKSVRDLTYIDLSNDKANMRQDHLHLNRDINKAIHHYKVRFENL